MKANFYLNFLTTYLQKNNFVSVFCEFESKHSFWVVKAGLQIATVQRYKHFRSFFFALN